MPVASAAVLNFDASIDRPRRPVALANAPAWTCASLNPVANDRARTSVAVSLVVKVPFADARASALIRDADMPVASAAALNFDASIDRPSFPVARVSAPARICASLNPVASASVLICAPDRLLYKPFDSPDEKTPADEPVFPKLETSVPVRASRALRAGISLPLPVKVAINLAAVSFASRADASAVLENSGPRARSVAYALRPASVFRSSEPASSRRPSFVVGMARLTFASASAISCWLRATRSPSV